jgi:hypothetical protein
MVQEPSSSIFGVVQIGVMKKKAIVKKKDRVFWKGDKKDGGTIIRVESDGYGGHSLTIHWDSPSEDCEDGIGHFNSNDIGNRLKLESDVVYDERVRVSELLEEVIDLGSNDSSSLFSDEFLIHAKAALEEINKALVSSEAYTLLKDD